MLAVLLCAWLCGQVPDHPRPLCARAAWLPVPSVAAPFPVPAAWAGQRVYLCAAGVPCRAVVRVDGRQLLVHDGASSEFAVELPASVAGRRVAIELGLGDAPRAARQQLWLEARGRAFVDTLQLTPGSAPGRVQVTATLGGDMAAARRVVVRRDATAAPVAELHDGRGELELPAVPPWTPAQPTLTPLQVVVLGAQEEVLDQVDTYFGRCDWQTPPRGLLLDGQSFRVRGALLPADASAPALQALTALGLNAVVARATELTPQLCGLADRLGLPLLVDARGVDAAWVRRAQARCAGHPSLAAWLTADGPWPVLTAVAAPQLGASAPGALAFLAPDGDDLSWPLLRLVAAARATAGLTGFVCARLPEADLGWSDLAPRMTLADVLGPVHVGTSGLELVSRARPGEEFAVPLVVAWAPDAPVGGTPTVRVQGCVNGYDDRGFDLDLPSRRGGAVTAVPDGLAVPPPLRLRLPEREGLWFLSAWATVPSELPADRRFGGRVLARTVCCVDTRSPRPPRARADGKELVLPFRPDAVWQCAASAACLHAAQVSWPGAGSVTYRLAVPAVGAIAGLTLRFEASTAGAAGRVVVTLQGQEMEPVALPAASADARGILSHAAGWQPGSHGSLCRIDIEGSEAEGLLDKAQQAGAFVVTLASAGRDDAAAPSGLRLFGSQGGRYPFDPELVLRCSGPAPVFDRDPVLVPAWQEVVRADQEWRSVTQDPGPGFVAPAFDDHAWGADAGAPGAVRWLRRRFPWDAAGARLWATIAPGGTDAIWIDGQSVLQLCNPSASPLLAPLPWAATAGSHVLAVHGRPIAVRALRD